MEHAEEPTPNRLAVRHANRERKRKQRARDKARSDRAVQAYFNRLQAAKVNADGLAWQQKRNLCTLGEIAPGVDAATIDEALEVAREFARALVISDVQNGESLQDFERLVFEAWVNYDKSSVATTLVGRAAQSSRKNRRRHAGAAGLSTGIDRGLG
jgi:hypothetical protein